MDNPLRCMPLGCWNPTEINSWAACEQGCSQLPASKSKHNSACEHVTSVWQRTKRRVSLSFPLATCLPALSWKDAGWYGYHFSWTRSSYCQLDPTPALFASTNWTSWIKLKSTVMQSLATEVTAETLCCLPYGLKQFIALPFLPKIVFIW